jgi:magnesium chelatase family protein
MRDRLDLYVHVEPASYSRRQAAIAESSADVAARIQRAWSAQLERHGKPNADLTPAELGDGIGLSAPMRDLLTARGRQLGLTLRRVHRAARVARTIADLEGVGTIAREHIDEALAHRPPEVAA